MVYCFLCNSQLKDFKSLRQHFSFTHVNHNFVFYKCQEGDCQRSFSIFNSFRRHFLKEHKPLEEPLISQHVLQGPSTSCLNMDSAENLNIASASNVKEQACIPSIKKTLSVLDILLSTSISPNGTADLLQVLVAELNEQCNVVGCTRTLIILPADIIFICFNLKTGRGPMASRNSTLGLKE